MMLDFRRMPLGQLSLYCPPLRQALSPEAQGAWRELYRRALGEQNPVAWDALLIRLWPTVLFEIYARAPELTPATAEMLAQRTLSAFKRRQTQANYTLPALPSLETLLFDLQHLIEQQLRKRQPIYPAPRRDDCV